jgi:hypothetical protein
MKGGASLEHFAVRGRDAERSARVGHLTVFNCKVWFAQFGSGNFL